VLEATFTGAAGLVRSQSCTVAGVMLAAATRSEVGASMAPVVEKPSRAENPPAAALTLPSLLRHTPPASSVPCARVQAARGVSLPQAAQVAEAGRGSRSRSMGKGTRPRPGSSSTCVSNGEGGRPGSVPYPAMAKVVIAASSCWGKTLFTEGKAAAL